MTENVRNIIEQSFAELFAFHENETLANNTNWKITPLTIYESAKQNDAKQKRIEAQAVLRGSVGGVQSILQIQQSVKDGTTSKDSAIAIMDEIFGIAEKKATRIIGEIIYNSTQDDITNIRTTTTN